MSRSSKDRRTLKRERITSRIFHSIALIFPASAYLSLFLLAGCQLPKIEDQPQRTIFLKFEECSPGRRCLVEEGDDRSLCLQRMYRWNQDYVGPVGSVEELPIEDCSLLIGHDPDSYESVADWHERVRKAFQRRKKKR